MRFEVHSYYLRFLLLFFLLKGISFTGLGQNNPLLAKPDINFSHKHYTLHDGLVQMQVTALYQDKKGFLWCGTKGGISRFDGKSFVNYSKSEAKLSGLVIKFGIDSKGNLLIYHPNGISAFNGKDFSLYNFEEGWTMQDYNSSFLDKNYVMLANNSRGSQSYCELFEFRDSILVSLYEGKQKNFFAHSDLKDKDLNWVLYRDSILQINLKNKEILQKYQEANVKSVFQLNDSVYCLKREGLYKLEGDSFNLIHPFLHKDSFPKPIYSVDGKSVFIKTLNIVYEFDEQDMNIVMDQLTYTRDLLFDYEENLWIATEEGLLNLFQMDFVNYSFIKDASDYVWTINEDTEKNMWFGSFMNGLWSWDGATTSSYTGTVRDDLRTKPMFYMGSSQMNKNIYFPAIQHVVKYDGEHLSLLKGTNGACLFSRVVEDSMLMVATHKGLYEFYNDELRRFWSVDTIQISRITTINTNQKDAIVLGGYEGLAIIDKHEIKQIKNDLAKSILAIEKDHLGNLWVGGINENLCLLSDDTLTSVYQFQNNAIHSLLYIDSQHLLIGCRNGLFILDLATYYESGEIHLLEYNYNNGFIGLECGQNAFFKDSDENVWIATSDIVTKFDPKKMIRKAAIPKIYIEPIEVSKNKIDWSTIPESDVQSINHNCNSIQFRFTSICFSAIDNIKYYYKLSGIQDEWSPPQKNNEIIFYNLSPGEYTFEVIADNGTSSVITPIISSSFQIKPALWQRSGFIIISVLLLIILFYLSIRFYFHTKLKKQEKELALERMRTGLQVKALDNKSNHHFIFNILNNIGFNIIKKDTEEAYTLFSRLAGYFRISLQSSDSFTTPLLHQIETINDYLYLQKNRLGDRLNYSVANNCKEYNHIDLPRNILQTITDNAVSHGIEPKEGGGFVDIEIRKSNKQLIISVKDNGIGRTRAQNINPHKKHGLGLNIYRNFFQLFNNSNELKADLIITDLMDDNQQASGTLVEIVIPENYSFKI